MAARKKTSTKAELAKALAIAKQAQPLVDIQRAGALLEVIAELVATGKTNTPLSKVLSEAEFRAQRAEWRKNLNTMLGGL